MGILTDWRPLSTEELVQSIPGLIERVESSLKDFPAEHHEKNLTALEALKEGAPTCLEIEDPSKNGHLVTLAFAVEQLARILAKSATPEQSLALFRFAHEIFRATIPSTGPNKQMRQVLPAALRTLIMTEIERVRTGETDAGLVHEKLNSIVSSAWGTVPPQLALMINEILLSELERVRATIEKDKALHERFLTDNIESVLSLEVPQRLAEVQDRWEEIGAHVAPTATRTAGRVLHRPQDLSELLTPESWNKIKTAVEEGNVEILRSSLAEAEDVLVKNLRLRLDAKADFREPISQLGTRHNPDRYFVEAYDLLLRDGAAALRKFSDIHFRRSNNTTAKEWYAYALARFGEKTDTHDVIELLEDVIQSEYYRPESNWTANWNLACALRRLPTRADESLDLLVPILENQYHPSEVFELCLLWSLDQDREEILQALLGRSYYFEAQLLAALYAAELLQDDDELSGDHFRRIGRILRDPDHEFPDPKERLSFAELDQLTREFMENSMVPAGIEWFHQRLSDQQGRFYSKNWDCAAKLHEEADNKEAAWQCYRRVWDCLVRDRKTDLDRKIGKLKFILNWSQRNGFERDALTMIKSSWERIGMSESDVRIWEQRLTKTSLSPQAPSRANAVPSSMSPAKPLVSDSKEAGQIREGGASFPTTTFIEADKVIQEIAGTFSGVSTAETLAVEGGNAELLLGAVQTKRPDVSSILFSSIREVIRLAKEFRNGVDGTQAQDLVQRMKLQLGTLRNNRESVPYEIRGLGQACERVIQNTCVRTGATTEITITPPEALKFVFEAAAPDKTRYASRMFARLSNPGLEEMRNINSVFSSPSAGIQFSGEGTPILRLNPGEKQIVECAFDVIGDLESEVPVRVHVTYSAGGVQLTNHVNCRIPVGTIREPVPVTVRYVTGAPVGADRVDLFHGRNNELLDLQEAFAGGYLRKLYFVNGIRRVGKSSLMEHLGKHCGSEVLTLSLNIETALNKPRMSDIEFVEQLIRESIAEARKVPEFSQLAITRPSRDVFELDPPWIVFDSFLENLRAQTGRKHVLVCFDEVQFLVKRIADPEDPIADGYLSWLRGKIQKLQGDVFLVCTGSESYSVMRKRYEHTMWANMEPYNISFVTKDAMEKIVTLPVMNDGVIWLPEALDRLWDMTEGHPWVTQVLAEKATERLNKERRRLVGPNDIDRAADLVLATDQRVNDLWWNEKEGLVTTTHRQVAFLILQNQPESRVGIAESRLAEVCQKGGVRSLGKYLEEMSDLEVLTEVKEGNDPRWRIRGAFLERYLASLMQRAIQESGGKPQAHSANQPLALLLDWENVKIRLRDFHRDLPRAKAEKLKGRLESFDLGNRLLNIASRYGEPRQRWAVANWEKPFFSGDQMVLKRCRYWPDIAGEDKDNASDHVLREKIHYVLRNNPEINVYVIATGDGDYGEVIKTLQEQGKNVVLLATRKALNEVYKYYLSGPDRIQIGWLEDLVFNEEESSVESTSVSGETFSA